ncbi:MAG: methyltransferase [Labilithrix sp.]|nr:methyltransferase [Labilithrix sp.]
MSDGPIKLSPADAPPDQRAAQDAPALDDIILGEDDHTVPIPPANARSSAAPTASKEADALAKAIEAGADDRGSRSRDRSSNRVKAADPAAAKNVDPGKDTRKRQKMTLRIPDDEVSRPQLPALDSRTPMGGVPAVGVGGTSGAGPSRPPSRPDFDDTVAMPLQPNRIISIGTADDTLELPAADLQARGNALGRAPGVDATHEAGWTPYQPAVADGGPDFGGERIVTRGQHGAAAAAKAAIESSGRMRDPAHTMLDEPGMGAMASIMSRDERTSSPPLSEDIPIDTDDDEPIAHDRFDELQTSPRLPAAPSSEEIKVDDGERHTDPGEVPEVAPEDLVSVESIPNPHSPHAPPLLKGHAKPVVAPSPSAVTATALMAGVPPHAATPSPGLTAPLASLVIGGGSGSNLGSHGVTPIAPAVAQRAASPSTPAPAAAVPSYLPPVAQPSAPAGTPPLTLADTGENAALHTGPAAGTPMARRQQPAGGPFGYMPQVGALAPPPMNESAANRKKTRPWWEDLFNDDFIRTMAKITDADIAREANFIEESLGCEAGATILDLACGTGRHAVELATRGYQVVGFDLSLAMLARASDEAQDRKQKINFVQGDMREMTFEETFDGVFSWNTSFGYCDEEKNAAVIAKVHRALKKGGQVLLDVVNRDKLVRQAPSLAWFEGDGCICMDEMQIDFITSRMKVKRTLMMDDGRTKEIEYSIRVYSLHELGKMLHDNGFRVAEVSGRTGTPGVFFGCESPRTLILAEKR